MVKKKAKNKDLIVPGSDDADEMSLIKDMVETGNARKGGNKQTKYFAYRYIWNFNIKDSAELSGYQPSYAYRLEQKYKNKPDFRQRVSKVLDHFVEHYVDSNKAKLLRVSYLEDMALDKCEEDPTLLLRHPRLVRDIKASAGVNLQDGPGITKNIVSIGNVEQIQMLIQGALDNGDSESYKRIRSERFGNSEDVEVKELPSRDEIVELKDPK